MQVGAAFATKLFAHLGPAGTVLLRVLFPTDSTEQLSMHRAQ